MSNDFAQMDRIADRLIQNVPFFKGFNKADLFGLLGKAGRHTYKPGDTIFRENDSSIDTLYVIMAGKVEVLKTSSDGINETVDSLGTGNCFGEMALIDNRPRSATVIAREPTVCLACTAEMIGGFQGLALKLYENLARIIAGRHLELDKQLLTQLKPMCFDVCVKKIVEGMPNPSAELPVRALAKLAEMGDAYQVKADSYVVKTNTYGQYMYLVLDGELVVRKGSDKDMTVLGNLKRGNYFGETALVSEDQGRRADVYAQTDAQLVRLSATHLYKTPEIGALVYRELARMFSMRLRQSTHIYIHTLARNCEGECEFAHPA